MHEQTFFSKSENFCPKSGGKKTTKAQIKIFICRKVMLYSQDVQVFVFLSIPWDRVHFWIYLFNHISLSHRTWPQIKVREIIFRNLLNSLEDWGQVAGPFQFRNLLQLLNKQLCEGSSISFFEKVNKGRLEMVNVNCYIKPKVC